jgi:hypothetical protein
MSRKTEISGWGIVVTLAGEYDYPWHRPTRRCRMKKNQSEKECRDLFTEQKRSGKTVRDFCRSEGVNENVFFRKKKQLVGTGALVRLPVGLGDINLLSSGSWGIRFQW